MRLHRKRECVLSRRRACDARDGAVLYDRDILRQSRRLHGASACSMYRLVVLYDAAHVRQHVQLHRTVSYAGAARCSIAYRACTPAPSRSRRLPPPPLDRRPLDHPRRPYAGKLPVARLLLRMVPLPHYDANSARLLRQLRHAQLLCVVKASQLQINHVRTCMYALSRLRPRLPNDVWRVCVWDFLLA